MAQENTKKVTLSFTSKSKKVSSALDLRQQSISKHRDNDSITQQTVTNIKDNLSNHHSNNSKQHIVIPLIKHNKWRKPSSKPPPLESESESDALTKQQQDAVNLIANNLNDSNDNSVSVAPIILAPKQQCVHTDAFNEMEANKVPGIEDVVNVKKRLDIDVALRPKQPDNEEYASVPLFNFGEAILRGMGWNRNIPVGNQYGANKNQLKIPKTTAIKPRPKNLGFGAVLTKKEAKHLIEKKYNPKKQRTAAEKKRIREIQSFTETGLEPPKKKQKIVENGNGFGGKKERIKWVRNGLKVRCINKENGYFRAKGIVNDVIDEYRFLIEMCTDSKLLTLYEYEIETVIPKKGELVVILNGKNRKEKACILKKDKHAQYATLQLQHDLSIVKCHYDDICAI